ncbi:hypothetical protein A3Q56_07574 [Intoshia linei]|uniref:Translation initiation factor eIF2B subunit delta n=1 Tax=Intoshia linei TaxID=1819745 RepID=A0A177ATL3_9BILA|nr:hypothetical protein A3Q56_07574 [Intoshia linei]
MSIDKRTCSIKIDSNYHLVDQDCLVDHFVFKLIFNLKRISQVKSFENFDLEEFLNTYYKLSNYVDKNVYFKVISHSANGSLNINNVTPNIEKNSVEESAKFLTNLDAILIKPTVYFLYNVKKPVVKPSLVIEFVSNLFIKEIDSLKMRLSFDLAKFEIPDICNHLKDWLLTFLHENIELASKSISQYLNGDISRSLSNNFSKKLTIMIYENFSITLLDILAEINGYNVDDSVDRYSRGTGNHTYSKLSDNDSTFSSDSNYNSHNVDIIIVCKDTCQKSHNEAFRFMSKLETIGYPSESLHFAMLSQASYYMCNVSFVLLEAEAMMSIGTVYVKSGSALIALSAKNEIKKVPVIIYAPTYRCNKDVGVINKIQNIIHCSENNQNVYVNPLHCTNPGKLSAYNDFVKTQSIENSSKGGLNKTQSNHKMAENFCNSYKNKNCYYDILDNEMFSLIVTEVGKLPTASIPPILTIHEEVIT